MHPEWIEQNHSSLIKEAFNFASEAHRGEKRMNGEDYIIHPLEVAKSVSDWKLDDTSVAAALLHDVVEDTSYTLKDLEKKFGSEIAFLVDGLTKLKNIQYKETKDAENLRKLILSFSQDLRVLIIKVADRLHNMKTLYAVPEEQQKRVAWETLEVYAPLAYRLGMQKLSGELEDLAFPYAYPEEYRWLKNEIKDDYEARQEYAKSLLPIVRKSLEENKINYLSVDSRAKRYYSLYKKLLRYDMNLGKIYDLVALRIIVKTIEECYASLGVIHKMWQPIPGRIKDYIARPKPNGYRSLHTTVFALDNKIIEIQIRTEEMHQENEMGIAAHWAYEQIKDSSKKKSNWIGVKSKRELLWVEQLRNWQKQFTNQNDFLESIKVDFLKDRIFVLTPENDVIDLPIGSTPVDFAYKIHSQIGDACVGAKVNGKIIPLDYELKSGDMVEIVTQKGKKPSNDWLRFAKTLYAKKHIKSILKASDRNLVAKSTPKSLEFKIVNLDRPGFLKDVTEVFASSKINITYFSSETDHRSTFSSVIIKCPVMHQSKIEALIVKLKKVPSTKEVNYKFLR